MRFTLRSARRDSYSNNQPAHPLRNGTVSYESTASIISSTKPGVSFQIRRISFGRRLELSRRIREISQKAEFLGAGSELHEKIEANLLAQQIDAIYLEWGLVSVEGLLIDGQAANAGQLLEKGPEELTREVLAAIKGECGLSEAERKN